jgi:hypothetical protein
MPGWHPRLPNETKRVKRMIIIFYCAQLRMVPNRIGLAQAG